MAAQHNVGDFTSRDALVSWAVETIKLQFCVLPLDLTFLKIVQAEARLEALMSRWFVGVCTSQVEILFRSGGMSSFIEHVNAGLYDEGLLPRDGELSHLVCSYVLIDGEEVMSIQFTKSEPRNNEPAA